MSNRLNARPRGMELVEINPRFDVDGRIQMKIPSRTVRIFGRDIHSPETWAPTAPVHGTVAASGRGQRTREPATP